MILRDLWTPVFKNSPLHNIHGVVTQAPRYLSIINKSAQWRHPGMSNNFAPEATAEHGIALIIVVAGDDLRSGGTTNSCT